MTVLFFDPLLLVSPFNTFSDTNANYQSAYGGDHRADSGKDTNAFEIGYDFHIVYLLSF